MRGRLRQVAPRAKRALCQGRSKMSEQVLIQAET